MLFVLFIESLFEYFLLNFCALYLFLQWKAPNDIVFNDEGSRVLPTNVRVHQNKRPISSIADVPPSPKRFKSGPSSSAGVAPQPSSGDIFASTFADLESALSRAAQLSLQLPTTMSRLACISGILPAEESLDEDAHRIVLNAEVGNLEHLQKTISQLRDGFCAYRNMQDSRCKPFEDRAHHYLSQIFKEDSAAAPDSRREAVDPPEINVSYCLSYVIFCRLFLPVFVLILIFCFLFLMFYFCCRWLMIIPLLYLSL